MKQVLCSVAVLAVVFQGGAVHGELIFEGTRSYGMGAGWFPAPLEEEIRLYWYTEDVPADPFRTAIFETFPITSRSVGQEIVVDATEPGFNEFVSDVTDGVPEFSVKAGIHHPSRPGGGGNARSEPDFFWNDPSGRTGIDLIDFEIDSIGMSVDELSMSNREEQKGYYFEALATVSLKIYGTPIPKPDPMRLLVNTLTGEIILDTTDATTDGFQIKSPSDGLIPYSGGPQVLPALFSANEGSYAEGGLTQVSLDGEVSLGGLYDTARDTRDLEFEYINIPGGGLVGEVVYIPEPASLLLLQFGGLVLLKRRRR